MVKCHTKKLWQRSFANYGTHEDYFFVKRSGGGAISVTRSRTRILLESGASVIVVCTENFT